MKPKDLTDLDHPRSWTTWSQDEVDFINTQVKLAYEEGRKDALTQREAELREEGVYPKWHLDSMVAAARLQGAEEERKKLADKERCLTDEELADPVYMRAYCESANDTIKELLTANKQSLARAKEQASTANQELLEALETLLACICDPECGSKIDRDLAIKDARIAIAKAEQAERVEPVALPGDLVIKALQAMDAEARKRGEMYPQTFDEQREDTKAVRHVIASLEFYTSRVQCRNGWPSVEGWPALPATPHAAIAAAHTGEKT